MSATTAARTGGALWIGAAVGFFAAEAIAASAMVGYSYATDYVSTLADPARSPRAVLVNSAFVVQGVVFPTAALLVARGTRRRTWPLALAAGINGVGNVLVAAVHSGTGSGWHASGAALAIVGGNVAVILGASALDLPRSWRRVSVALGVAGLLCLGAVGLEVAPVGLWERACVYSIFAWQAATGMILLGRRGCGDIS